MQLSPTVLLLVFAAASFKCSNASWINLLGSLGTTSTVSHYWNSICEGQDFFVRKQREICLKYPSAMAYIYSGARRSIQECRKKFFWERWNCTWMEQPTVQESRHPYGFTPPNVTEPSIPPVDIMNQGTRESAYLHSVTSAGVVHAITQACSAGNLTDCSCDNIPIRSSADKSAFDNNQATSNRRQQTPGNSLQEVYVSNGCSDNIAHGIWFSQSFVDASERRGAKKAARDKLLTKINLHNNEAGRLAVKRNMRTQCRCHGVSGSCSTKTCFKALPTLAEIAQILKAKYEKSVEVMLKDSSQSKLQRKAQGLNHVRVQDDEMVFMARSPNYCFRNVKKGIIGTRNRMCNKSISDGPGSCKDLCCDRHYVSSRDVQNVKCQCKFVWCCVVQCKQCPEVIERSVCN